MKYSLRRIWQLSVQAVFESLLNTGLFVCAIFLVCYHSSQFELGHPFFEFFIYSPAVILGIIAVWRLTCEYKKFSRSISSGMFWPVYLRWPIRLVVSKDIAVMWVIIIALNVPPWIFLSTVWSTMVSVATFVLAVLFTLAINKIFWHPSDDDPEGGVFWSD